jgi:hypothetical protein
VKRLRLLVLYWNWEPWNATRLTIPQHLHTLDQSETRHQILYWNALRKPPRWLGRLNFDAIIFHYSLLGMRTAPEMYQKVKQDLAWVGAIDCIKLAIPQDEYDRCFVLDDWMIEWNVNIIFSCFEANNQKILYPKSFGKVQFYTCFTGYIDEQTAKRYAAKATPIAERPNDIIYRARNLPFWFGSQGQLKHRIADIVGTAAQQHGLKTNISTRQEDTIVGQGWMDFLCSGKAVIGVESGLSTKDPYGEIKSLAQSLLADNPDITFEELSALMPDTWDSYQFFAISPRHFEVVVTKTCQLLVEGSYSGVLIPYRHYIPIKRDYSNLDEALESLKDTTYVQAMVDRAYEELYLSEKFTYRQFSHMLENAIIEMQGRVEQRNTYPPLWFWYAGRFRTYLNFMHTRLVYHSYYKLRPLYYKGLSLYYRLKHIWFVASRTTWYRIRYRFLHRAYHALWYRSIKRSIFQRLPVSLQSRIKTVAKKVRFL